MRAFIRVVYGLEFILFIYLTKGLNYVILILVEGFKDKREDKMKTREEIGKEIKRLEMLRATTRDTRRRIDLTNEINKLNSIYWGK